MDFKDSDFNENAVEYEETEGDVGRTEDEGEDEDKDFIIFGDEQEYSEGEEE